MNIYDLWFASANISNKVKYKLIKQFKSTDKIWYYCIVKKNNNMINIKLINLLEKVWNKNKLEEIQSYMVESHIKAVTIMESIYPEKLKCFEDSPYMLFYKGNIDELNRRPNVSIVGSRNCSPYGTKVTREIVNSLCNNSINIISGMAKGIDRISHIKSVERDNYTCAVLGSGVDVIYPKENVDIYDEISKKGCVISEFLPGTKPYNYNFPIRNRIISGLCDLLIVVEAGYKSGSLITARYAAEQGKDVIAVPGNIFSKTSYGTNKLISDGAFPLTEINDIFHLMGIDPNLTCDNSSKSILSKRIGCFITDKPVHIDDIVLKTNIDINKVYKVLFEMQLNNEIIQLSNNYYVKP